MPAMVAHSDALTRLIFDVLQDLGHHGHRPIAVDAVAMLKLAAEEHLEEVFKIAGSLADNRKSATVELKDFRLACNKTPSPASAAPIATAIPHVS